MKWQSILAERGLGGPVEIHLKSRQNFPIHDLANTRWLMIMKPIYNFRFLPAGILAVFGLLTMGAAAALPYLPLIGPPPMRIMTYRSDTASVVKFYTATAVVSTNALSSSTNKLAGAGYSADLVGPVGEPVSTGSAMVAPRPYSDTTMGVGEPSGVFEMPTPNLVAISPQMLANYFRPVQVGTNSAVFTDVSPISFIPPVPIDKSSHAEYIVK